jgi:hypothetical protein
MDKLASPDYLSCSMLFLRYVLINFSLEKLLSAVATVTGNVKNSRKAVIRAGNVDNRE